MITWVLAGVVAVLFGSGVYLLLQRSLTRIVLGLAIIGHGANLILIAAGGTPGRPPLVGPGSEGPYSDPLPHAMALTAIVISFAVTAFLAGLAYRSYQIRGSDEVEDDIEDRRIARSVGDEADEADLADDPNESSREPATEQQSQPMTTHADREGRP